MYTLSTLCVYTEYPFCIHCVICSLITIIFQWTVNTIVYLFACLSSTKRKRSTSLTFNSQIIPSAWSSLRRWVHTLDTWQMMRTARTWTTTHWAGLLFGRTQHTLVDYPLVWLSCSHVRCQFWSHSAPTLQVLLFFPFFQAPSCVLRMLDDECRFPKVKLCWYMYIHYAAYYPRHAGFLDSDLLIANQPKHISTF